MKQQLMCCLVFLLLGIIPFSCSGPKVESEYETNFQRRASLLIEHVADHYPAFNQGKRPSGYDGKLSDFGKYNYPKIVALFSQYGDTLSEWNERLDFFAQKPTFHFNLLGLPRILYLFPEAAGVKQNELAFLEKVFERTDSYNPWTAEGTENHIAMSRCSGYLYAQLAQEKYPKQFPEAQRRMQQMKDWMAYFSKKVLETGTGEWNSSIYGPYNILPWINVYDFATDPEVQDMAKVVLDYYATELALHYSQGLIGGSDMRGQKNTKSFNGSAAYLAWLWYGGSPTPLKVDNLNQGAGNATHLAQIIHAATSKYRPHPLMVNLVQTKGMHYNSKADYLLNKPAYIKQTFYKSTNYSLGAAYLPYGGWSSGDYQIVSWKLISQVSPGMDKSVQYLSGIGMQTPNGSISSGNMRSPFDQLAHHENVLVQLTRVPEKVDSLVKTISPIFEQWQKDWTTDFQKRFPEDQHKLSENPIKFQALDLSKNASHLILHPNGEWAQYLEDSILVLSLEKNWVLIQSVRSASVEKFKASRNKKDTFYVSSLEAEKGKIVGFILEVIEKTQYSTLQLLKDQVFPKIQIDRTQLDSEDRLVYTSSQGDTLDMVYQQEGTFTEPIFDWGYGHSHPMVIPTSPPIQQPAWPVGMGHGKLARWKINGELVDLEEEWPVYSGPNVKIGGHQLHLVDGQERYKIDYTGEKPIFMY